MQSQLMIASNLYQSMCQWDPQTCQNVLSDELKQHLMCSHEDSPQEHLVDSSLCTAMHWQNLRLQSSQAQHSFPLPLGIARNSPFNASVGCAVVRLKMHCCVAEWLSWTNNGCDGPDNLKDILQSKFWTSHAWRLCCALSLLPALQSPAGFPFRQ